MAENRWLLNLERDIRRKYYSYEYAKRMVASLMRAHGLVKSGDKPVTATTEDRRAGLEAIGLGLGALRFWEGMMKELGKELGALVQEHPLWDTFFRHIRGVGPLLAGMVIGASGDITRVDKPSGFRKSAGLDVGKDGKAPRKKRGKRGHPGHPAMRSMLGQLRLSIFRQAEKGPSFYYGIYEREKEWYKENRPEWREQELRRRQRKQELGLELEEYERGEPGAGHYHAAAIRVMEQLFLDHLYQRWRPLHGLPCPKPYIFAMEDGHTFIEWEPDLP